MANIALFWWNIDMGWYAMINYSNHKKNSEHVKVSIILGLEFTFFIFLGGSQSR